MNLKKILPRLALLSMLMIVFSSVLATSLPAVAGPYVQQHWTQIIISADEQMTALMTHDVDVGGVPRPADLASLQGAGYTITKMERIGYTFLMENNRKWPFGVPCGGNKDPYGIEDPLNAEWWRAVYFRKGVNRLTDKAACVGIHAPLMGAADWWLPPGQAAWINPDYPAPTFDPYESDAMFDAGGFTDTGSDNPEYDPDWHPASAQKLRVDPLTGKDLALIEYYAIGPTESPLGFEMAQAIASWMRKMGLQVDLVAGTWLGMVLRLINPILDDYQLMTGVGIIWGSTAPDILYDFVYSKNLPLWDFSVGNYTELDYWALKMMSTLDLAECKLAAYKIQEYQSKYEPYNPLLLWELYTAMTGPWPETEPPYTHPGFIGIVNEKGFGVGWFTRLRGHADRYHPETGAEINKWIGGAYLDSLNPMEADTAPDWVLIGSVEEGLISLNPYTHAYECYGAAELPIIKPWVTPGRFQDGGDEKYNGDYYNGADGIFGTDDDTYEGKLIKDVTGTDLKGDDQLAMQVTWKLRNDLYWHDDNPAGVRRPITTADVLYAFEMMINQRNDRYFSNWWYVWDVQPVDSYTFKIYEERRYIFAFEAHGIGLYAPKHIWEPWIGPTRTPISGIKNIQKWTSWVNDEHEWRGWEKSYMEDPQYPGQMLTELIGFGPYVYHLGGWTPGVCWHVEANRKYLNGMRVCPGDTTLSRLTDLEDYYSVRIRTFGATGKYPPSSNWDPACDVCFPAQTIDLAEVMLVRSHFGDEWGPGGTPCPGE